MWFIFALLTSLLYAIYHICNQESKLNADIFIIYRGFLTAIIATPLALLYHHIFPAPFYAIILFQGLTISYMDYKYFQAFHKFGAENVNAVRPLTILIVFTIWLVIKPSIITTYLANPVRSAIIILSLATTVFAVMKYHNQPIGKKCLQEVIPLLFLSSAVDTSNKLITEYNDGCLLTLTIHRVALTGWIIGCINLFLHYKKTNFNALFNPQNLKRGSFIIFLILSMITVNLAMYHTPNPAYTSAILYLSVIWILLINKTRFILGKSKNYPHIAPRWILLLLCSSVALIIATQNMN